MSRHTKRFGTVEYSYGYDVPLQEFFFEKCDSKLATDKNNEGYVFQISSNFSLKPHPKTPNKTKYSRGDILTIVEEEEALIGKPIMDEDDKMALATDQQF